MPVIFERNILYRIGTFLFLKCLQEFISEIFSAWSFLCWIVLNHGLHYFNTFCPSKISVSSFVKIDSFRKQSISFKFFKLLEYSCLCHSLIIYLIFLLCDVYLFIMIGVMCIFPLSAIQHAWRFINFTNLFQELVFGSLIYPFVLIVLISALYYSFPFAYFKFTHLGLFFHFLKWNP